MLLPTTPIYGFGFSPLPGFMGSEGGCGKTDIGLRQGFSPLPGFMGSEGAFAMIEAIESVCVSVRFRGLWGLKVFLNYVPQAEKKLFQSPSGVYGV